MNVSCCNLHCQRKLIVVCLVLMVLMVQEDERRARQDALMMREMGALDEMHQLERKREERCQRSRMGSRDAWAIGP